jgi:probable F420-dependent oxidoreductase
VFIGGFGARMVEVTGEVADGLIVHPFSSPAWLREVVLPSLARGAERGGREVSELEVMWVTMVVTWSDEAERIEALASARGQLAFYGSTPAYAPVLELHGFGDLHPTLNRLSKQGRWEEMADLIPDELLEQIVVAGPRDQVAARVAERAAGLADGVSLVNSRRPDPANFADIARALVG